MFQVRSIKKTSECSLVGSKESESSESENARIVGEINVDYIFLTLKGIVHLKFVPENRTVNCKVYKEMVKGMNARVNHIRPEF
jgi:hypothetical protein